MSTRLRDNKARENAKTAGKRQRSTGHVWGNQTQTIQSELLHQAMKNPQGARPETIMQLQRIIGNRTVNQLVGQPVADRPQPQVNSPVQRLVDFNFTAKVGAAAAKFRPHDTGFKVILDAYEAYKGSKTIKEEYDGLTKLINLSLAWRSTYKDKYAKSKKDTDLENLLKLCYAEKKQVAYMYKMETGAFKYITSSGSGAHRHKPEEQKFATQNQLTKAELTAIKVYTGGDYKYINPTLLKNEGWLDASIKGMTGPTKANIGGKEVEGPSVWMGKSWLEEMKKKGPTGDQKDAIKLEALQHSGMAVKGLSKLPDVNQTTYRGMGLSKEQIGREYQKGQTVSHNLFISTSNKPETARNFAAENSTGGKVGIFFTIRVIKGKDVTMFSEAKSESEILLLPGAIFIVNEIHKPDATDNFYRITMTQTS